MPLLVDDARIMQTACTKQSTKVNAVLEGRWRLDHGSSLNLLSLSLCLRGVCPSSFSRVTVAALTECIRKDATDSASVEKMSDNTVPVASSSAQPGPVSPVSAPTRKAKMHPATMSACFNYDEAYG